MTRTFCMASLCTVLVLPALRVQADGIERSGRPYLGKEVQLSRPAGELNSLVTRFRRGEDIRRDLVRTLDGALPGGYFSMRSVDGKNLRVSKSTASDGDWLQLHVADASTFKRHFFGGGHYTRDAKFNLRADPESRAHSRITKMEFDGSRLFIRQKRDAVGRRYDRGKTYQDLEVRFDPQGRLQSFAVGNRGPWWTFSRQKLTVPINGSAVRTQDPVYMIKPSDPYNGTTLHRP